MLAFTRKPPPEDDVSQPPELLLDDADDALVPLASNTPPVPTAESTELVDDVASNHVVSRPWSGDTRNSYNELQRFVETDEPLLGWQRVLFAVSGIRLRPSRRERALRAHVSALLNGINPPPPNPNSETPS